MSLLDALKQTLQAQPAMGPAQTATAQETQQAISQVATGKATSDMGGAPMLSDLPKQQAELQAKAALQQQQQQGALIAEEMTQQQAQQELQLSEQEIDLQEKRLNQAQWFQQSLRTMLSNFEAEKDKMSVTRQQAKYEQMGFLMRLSNEQYIHQLQLEGQRARLTNEFAFEENLQRMVFEEETELLENDLNFRSLLAIDERQFKEEMADMDLDMALALAQAESKAATVAAVGAGLGQVGEAYARYLADKPKPPPGNNTGTVTMNYQNKPASTDNLSLESPTMVG